MGGVLIFAETTGKKIHPVVYELLGKGRELADALGADLSALLLTGEDLNSEELIYHGADKVFFQKDHRFSLPNEIIFKVAAVELITEEQPEVFLIGATPFGRSLAPRIAMALRTGLTADCTGLEIDEEGNLVQIRPAFSGNILAHIKTRTRPQMATVRYKEMPEARRDTERAGLVIEKEFNLPSAETGVKVTKELESSEVNLAEAEIVVSGGRGLKDPKDLGLLSELAELLHGEVGASRPLVDEGWINRDHQVGYSGNRVKPRIYIACGISGQSQHLAGMKDSGTIVAINKDPSAPIFKLADYGIVGDLYEVMPELIKQLKEE
jgi:electron transfer flavoprotein alpha subunit